MLLAHGLEGDFEKATSKFPKGPGGKSALLNKLMGTTHKYVQQAIATVEDQAPKVEARKASSKNSMTSE